jgi:DNA-binding MarR family transcriptional regulator
MTIFATQHIRDKAGVAWGEEYVIGLVEKTEPITTTRLHALINKQSAMVTTTANYHIKNAINKKLIYKHNDPEDKRLVYHSLTEKGRKLMEDLRNAVK